MASPIRQAWNSIPVKIRNGFSMLMKFMITLIAFYLLLNHQVQMIDHRSVRLENDAVIQLAAGDEILMGSTPYTLKNGLKIIGPEGNYRNLKDAQTVKLKSGQTGILLPLERQTTFRAIMEYLPRIKASTFWTFVLLAALIKSIGILASMYRWHLLLQGQGIRFPFWHIAGSFLIGRFLGTFLPSTIGLDGYKLYDATRFSRRVVESTAATIIEKVLGIVGIFITFLVALPLGLEILGAQAVNIAFLTVPISVGIIVVFFTLLFYPGLVQWCIEHLPIPGRNRIEKFIQRVSRSAAAYRDQKLLLINAAFQSFLVHFCTAAMYFFTALAIGAVGATFWQVTFASSIQIFATVISPITIAGEGIREIAQYYLLRNQLGPAQAIVSAALGFWAAEALTLFGGIFWWARKRTYRPSFLYLDGRQADLEALMHRDDIGIEDLKQPEEILSRGWVRNAFFARIAAGFSAGLLAGVMLGLVESFWLFFSKSPSADMFAYGMILYGLIGAAAGTALGTGLGLVAVALGHVRGALNTFALVLSGWFSLNILVLGRFRLFRDIWKEQTLPFQILLVLMAGTCICFVILFHVARRNNTPVGSRIRNSLILSAALIAAGITIGLSGGLFFERPVLDPPIVPKHLQEAPNVILIMCDALRADHIGCYGYSAAQTPVIDSLAGMGIRFKFCYGQASWTKPGTASIFTGMYPSGHTAVLKPDILPDSVTTLAEVFRDAGYHAVGFPNNINISPGFNFGQGFDEYHYLAPDYFFFASEAGSQFSYYSILRLVRERYLFKSKQPRHYYQEAGVVVGKSIDYLDRRGNAERFFLYLHFMEPHDPYFSHPFDGTGYARVDMPDPDPSLAGVFRRTYDEEITYMDEWIGHLFQALKERNLWNDTIILITADHGEEFFDHGGWWHGTTLYQEQIAIPMVFKLPRNDQAGTVRLDNARQIDIAPTLLSLCGIPHPDSMSFGRSLFHTAGPLDRIKVFSEENHEGNILSSLIDGDFKYITANRNNPRNLAPEELYRLDLDPHETDNVLDDHPVELQVIRNHHELMREEAGKNAVVREQKMLSDEELERMKALGYITE
ncbi:sulfatase-like hydrolase/transferase [bacterium]|nr:sulfatase-like hydrolase/transferase [candidate division CSSED10-310 bacterium]